MAEEMTDFERARALIIARNQARLAALGIHEAASAVEQATSLQRKPAGRDGHKAPKKRSCPTEAQGNEGSPPRRRSRRLRGEAGAADEVENDDLAESHSQLAVFTINGICPNCGRVVTRGHRKHLDNCSSATQRPQKPLADMIQAEMQKIETDNAKLRELELGGLIGLDDDHAVFNVVGSTGKHYKIEFTGEKRSCQCPDHRIRKRDCKHIRLLLKSLCIENDPSSWKSATANLIKQHPKMK
eukprot:jgi/Ulvmu1/4650/UM002_0381.1